MNLEGLKSLVRAEPQKGGDTTTVVAVSTGDDVDRVAHTLGRFFADNDTYSAVLLEIDGEAVGYLDRQDFYSEKYDRSRLGEAQSAQLPGFPEYAFLELACPVESCNTQVFRIRYDEHNPDRCPIHPGQMLQVVK